MGCDLAEREAWDGSVVSQPSAHISWPTISWNPCQHCQCVWFLLCITRCDFFLFWLILPSCWQGLNYSLFSDRNLKRLTIFFPRYLRMVQIVIACQGGKSSFISWLKECSRLSMTSVIWHQRPEIDCLVVPLSPVCVEVFFGGKLRRGGYRGERLRDTREGESCFVDLAVHHSTHRLAFLNYAKLHLQWACQRLRLWAPA